MINAYTHFGGDTVCVYLLLLASVQKLLADTNRMQKILLTGIEQQQAATAAASLAASLAVAKLPPHNIPEDAAGVGLDKLLLNITPAEVQANLKLLNVECRIEGLFLFVSARYKKHLI
jgi:hypothetical protein